MTEGYGGKWRKYAKRLSNKRIRRYKDVPNGSSFKKILDSWDLCDFHIRYDKDSDEVWKWRNK